MVSEGQGPVFKAKWMLAITLVAGWALLACSSKPTDVPAAETFYKNVVGWNSEPFPSPSGMRYRDSPDTASLESG